MINMRKIKPGLILAATCLSGHMFAGAAASDAESFVKCRDIANDKARLACYDAAAGKVAPQEKAVPVDDTRGEPVSLKAEKQKLEAEIQQLKQQKKALDAAEKTRKSSLDINYDGLSATITKIIKLPGGRLRLYLNNNQVWDQVASGRTIGWKVGKIVEMKEGALGSVILKVKDKKAGVKFRRVK